MTFEAAEAVWTDAMVRACWQGAVATLIAWIVCTLLLRKAAPSTRAAIWWLACLKTLVAFAISVQIAIPVLSAERSPFADIQHRLDLLAPTIHGHASGSNLSAEGPNPTAHEPSSTSTSISAESAAPTLAMCLWLIGAVGLTVWTTHQALIIRKLLIEAIPLNESALGAEARRLGVFFALDVRPKVAESERVSAPMVVGLFHPTVLVPKHFADELSSDELQMALAHELAHIRRKDLLLGVIPSICQILFFFFPPIWLALRSWSLEREAACDADALAATTGTPAGYGRMLMKIVTRDHKGGFVPALGATAGYHTLKKRLEMIMSFTHPGRLAKFAAVTLVTCGLLLTLPWQLSARSPVSNEINLLKNAGFESGSDLANWSLGTLPPGANPPVSVSIDSGTAHSGKASLKFQKSERSYFPVQMCAQQIPIDPSQSKIRVKVWVKAESTSKATLAVMFVGDPGSVQWGAYVGPQSPGGAPFTHDWKLYGAVLAVPSGTKAINIALEMYGPGTVWFDDVSASYVPASTPLQAANTVADDNTPAEDPESDIKDVSNLDSRAGKDPMKRYFLINSPSNPQPADGYKLLLVMPGGDGSADFNPFVRRISKFALPPGYVIAELVAPKWSDSQFNQLVWPTHKQRFVGMKFSTEDFVEAVVADVSKKVKIDPSKVFTLSWSSGGPAAYAAALAHGSVKGSFIAMSVFHPNELPPLFEAKGFPFYILHSPDDKLIPIAQAQAAADELKKAGATTKIVEYAGGHGWHGDVFGSIRQGVSWLESPKSN